MAEIAAGISMYILHIETSTEVCSVALSNGNNLIAFQDMKEGMTHASILVPAIDRLLKSNALSPVDLGAISVSSGPGSYTGLRVGSSTAKAMAYSLTIPLLAIPTLKALAGAVMEKYKEADYAMPMIDARRKEVYTALYNRSLEEIWPVSSLILDPEFFSHQVAEYGNVYACGDGVLKIDEISGLAGNLKIVPEIECSARHLIRPAVEMLGQGKTNDPLRYVPYYMKPPNITQSKKAGYQ